LGPNRIDKARRQGEQTRGESGGGTVFEKIENTVGLNHVGVGQGSGVDQRTGVIRKVFPDEGRYNEDGWGI
jgi:hypothetical protein